MSLITLYNKERMIRMKKTVGLLVSLLLTILLTSALADGYVWYCPVCGTQLDGEYNFCWRDGTPRPAEDTGYDGAADYQPTVSWPARTLNGVATSLRKLPEESDRHQSKCGPGTAYHGAGAYKPYKVTSAKALFKEGTFVYVDMYYTTVGHRCVYFFASSVTNPLSVPEVSLTGTAGRTWSALTPRFGPGLNYDSFPEANIYENTAVTVFFETDGWLFCEFDCALGPVRAWLPADQVYAE